MNNLNYLNINLEDALEMARRHDCDPIESYDLDDDTLPIWASNNYNNCNFAPGDVDELCYHACISVGAYTRGVISQVVYLQAMRYIDQRLHRHYRTSLEIELYR